MSGDTISQGSSPLTTHRPLVPASRVVVPMQPIVSIPRAKRIPLSEYAAKRAKTSRGDLEDHELGIYGEWCVARLLGIEHQIDTNVYECGDGGVDLHYRGRKIDVKTVRARTSNPDLWIDATQPIRADYYVLVQQLSTSQYRVIGYAPAPRVRDAYKMDISEAVQWHAECVRVINQDDLHPIPWTASMFGGGRFA